MRVDIVKIGNSQGIRIPKPLLEQCGLTKTADLRIENNSLIITAEHTPRQGWAEAFAAATQTNDDTPFIGEMLQNKFDEEEWEW